MPSRPASSASREGGRPTKTRPASTTPFAKLRERVEVQVDARLRRLFEYQLRQARRRGASVAELVEAVRDLCLRGGKRLRAALAAAGQQATRPTRNMAVALELGVALELLQAFLLIHDDWMDGDTVRRGGPSVHTRLGERYQSTHLGDRAGVLAGDYASALALQVLGCLPLPAARLVRVVDCYAAMQLEVIAGQQLDLVGDAPDAETTYVLKTASYTVRGPLRLGALIAGAGPELLAALDRYAAPLGVAFQLRDDMIGAFGSPQHAGKSVGGDLRAGKRTVLLEFARKNARGRDRRELERALSRSATDDEIRAALQVLERTGARQAVERRIDQLVARAKAAIVAGPVAPRARELLLDAAGVLTARTL